MALCLTALQGIQMLWAAIVTILVTRSILAIFLWYYDGRIRVSYPWLLYFNQITNAGVKIYLYFRLAKQRWRNRGDQRVAERNGWMPAFQKLMASYLTYLATISFIFALCMIFVFKEFPRLAFIRHLVGMGQ